MRGDRRAALLWALLLGCGFGTSMPSDSAGLGQSDDTGSTGSAADGNDGNDGNDGSTADGSQGGTADGGVTGSTTDDDDDEAGPDDDDATGGPDDDDDDDDDDDATDGPGDTGDTGGSSSDGMMGDDDDDDVADPYGPCPGGSSAECTGDQVCLAGGGLPSACAQPCNDVGDCPPPPDGDATPFCSMLAGACLLSCAGGETCPAGMSCIGDLACGHN